MCARFLNIPFRFKSLPSLQRNTGQARFSGETSFSETNEVNHGSYGALLFDERWKSKRHEILQRDNYMCRICKESKNLHVHHRQYHYIRSANQFKPPWEYTSNLLITLCSNCHSRGHNKFKVPNIQI
jgi:hypothetical protein